MERKQKNDYLTELRIKRIKECMAECKLTQKEIAKELNYTEQHISYVFNGRRVLTTDMAINLAHVFSKKAQSKPIFIDIPYSELPKDQKSEYCVEDIKKNGCVSVAFDVSDTIDYRYLLGEVDCKTCYENFDAPLEKDSNFLFQNGIKAILHKRGYELIADQYIGMNFGILEKKVLDLDSTFHGIISKNLTDNTKRVKIVKLSTGDTISISLLELCQLINDYERSLISITDRFFEKAMIQRAINTPPRDTLEKDKVF